MLMEATTGFNFPITIIILSILQVLLVGSGILLLLLSCQLVRKATKALDIYINKNKQ